MHQATDRLCHSTTHTLQKAFAKATPAWKGIHGNPAMTQVPKGYEGLQLITILP
jgi:predicted CxxxxCH...CXXCH cytochrome family protein